MTNSIFVLVELDLINLGIDAETESIRNIRSRRITQLCECIAAHHTVIALVISSGARIFADSITPPAMLSTING